MTTCYMSLNENGNTNQYLLLGVFTETGGQILDLYIESWNFNSSNNTASSVTENAGGYSLSINKSNGTVNWDSTKIASVTINSIQAVNNSTVFPLNQRVVVQINYMVGSKNNWQNYILCQYNNNSPYVSGQVYSIKYFNADGSTQAYFDMDYGLQDQYFHNYKGSQVQNFGGVLVNPNPYISPTGILTERGRDATTTLTEHGRGVYGNLTDLGFKIFGIPSVGGITNPPNVTIVSVDHYTISNQDGMNFSDVTFYFDTDVTSWTINLLGVSNDTGTVLISGGAVSANTNMTATIYGNQLTSEGSNQLNLYGQNTIGWTPYEDNN